MIFNEVSQSTPGFQAFNITTDLKSLVTTDVFKITKTQVFIHGLKIYIGFFFIANWVFPPDLPFIFTHFDFEYTKDLTETMLNLKTKE